MNSRRIRVLCVEDHRIVREGIALIIKRQADMGVDEFILRPCAEDLDQMERLGELAAKLGATSPE